MDAEAATIDAFVLKARRPRVRALTAKTDRAARLEQVLCHERVLDAQFMTQVPPSAQSPEQITDLLRSKGAPRTCRVMGGELDGQDLELADALRRVVGWGGGCLVICQPGRLAYYEGEEPNTRFVLER